MVDDRLAAKEALPADNRERAARAGVRPGRAVVGQLAAAMIIAALPGCYAGARQGYGSSECGGTYRYAYLGPLDGTIRGDVLADVAERVAERRNTRGRCYAAVAEAVRRAVGVRLSGRSAFVAADQLSDSPWFDEVGGVCPEDLPDLPAGATVVWPRTPRSPHGHIAVALGNGWEASDHIQRQLTSLRGHDDFRIFVPLDPLD